MNTKLSPYVAVGILFDYNTIADFIKEEDIKEIKNSKKDLQKKELSTIYSIVCHYFGTTEAELLTNSRKGNIPKTRHYIAHIARKRNIPWELINTITRISRVSISNALTKIGEEYALVPKVRKEIDGLNRRIDEKNKK